MLTHTHTHTQVPSIFTKRCDFCHSIVPNGVFGLNVLRTPPCTCPTFHVFRGQEYGHCCQHAQRQHLCICVCLWVGVWLPLPVCSTPASCECVFLCSRACVCIVLCARAYSLFPIYLSLDLALIYASRCSSLSLSLSRARARSMVCMCVCAFVRAWVLAHRISLQADDFLSACLFLLSAACAIRCNVCVYVCVCVCVHTHVHARIIVHKPREHARLPAILCRVPVA